MVPLILLTSHFFANNHHFPAKIVTLLKVIVGGTDATAVSETF